MLFNNFRYFFESYSDAIKTQLPTTQSAAQSQPIMIPAGVDFGKFKGPFTAYVVSMNDKTVTLSAVPQSGTFSPGFDDDGEMNLNNRSPESQTQFIIARKYFDKLLEPPASQQPAAGL